jgi:hypothetical protein
LEKVGLEDEMRRSLDDWIALIGRGCTTCPEEPHHPRSECHAWSALPLYEFTRTMAGVRQESGKIVIRPRMFDLPDFSGTVVTPLGTVRCAYRTDENGTHQYDVSLPEGARGLFITPSGQQIPFTGSLNIME